MAVSDLSDSRSVIQAMREFDQLKRTRFLQKHGFGKAKEYMLRDQKTGQLYDSKAIVGVAHGYQYPKQGALKSGEFSGGEAEVEKKLLSLGFEVVRIGDDWTSAEVDEIVADYFAMLALESASVPFNKAERNRVLRATIPSRSKASVELKHQNISAILAEAGLPYIAGYKPRDNYQVVLRDAVHRFIDQKNGAELVQRVIDNLETVSDSIALPSWQVVLVEAPRRAPGRKLAKQGRLKIPRRLDYAARDNQNRALGAAGEEWVLKLERSRLRGEGRADLAKQIEWVSRSEGDGLGYDVRSFNTAGDAIFIEVKTTNGAIRTPFLISRNEVEFSSEQPKSFCLYRVFNFRNKPQLYVLKGDLKKALALDAQVYRAVPN